MNDELQRIQEDIEFLQMEPDADPAWVQEELAKLEEERRLILEQQRV